MNELLKKLNFKTQKTLTILNSPKSFEMQMADFQYFANVKTSLDETDLEFFLAFVTKQDEINTLVPQVVEKIKADEVFWLAYPKGTSKNYKCDFNRDKGWEILGKYGFETVRMVAIDEDWSAMRFRKIEFVNTFKRNEKMALSEKGKMRLKGN